MTEYEELKKDVNEIKELLKYNPNIISKVKESILYDILVELSKLSGITRTKPIVEGKNILVLVVLQEDSADYFKAIAKIKINEAKKHPDYRIEIRPVDNIDLIVA
ncbi:MAG: hypothetical protein FWH37_09480 [Candidatus Bathyarchaeota archaeon]|nr:hypothetical protein [Candidatus Termiticorpusculum sp.]